MKRTGVLIALAVTLLLPLAAQAGRIYGTANISWQHTEESGDRLVSVIRPGTEIIDQYVQSINVSDDLNSETLLLNYEDILFYKNRVRLSAYLYRREMGLSDRREFRPIYSAELRSFGYFLSTSFSPYTQRAASPTGTGFEPIDIEHHEWRNTVSISYPKVPTLALVMNRNESHDDRPVHEIDGETRNFLIESNYSIKTVSARVNYANLRQESRQAFPFTNVQKSYTGTLSLSQQLGGLGYFSSNYTYYNSRNTRANDGLEAITRSTNHSMALMLGTQRWYNLSGAASYSGRFAESKIQQRIIEARNQAYSGQVSYNPFEYLTFDATKTYQLNNDRGENDITENLSLAATVTRSLRRGISTRFTASRIWVQQSQVTDANIDGRYNLDTYYASLGFEPYGFIRTMLDGSLVHNSEPSLPEQRYQMNMSLNSRFFVSRKIEGRINMTALYQGRELEIGRSYSQNINFGVTYTPQSNLSFNVSYLYTILNSSTQAADSSRVLPQIKSGTWIGYASYSFRRAFTLSVSANRQDQESPINSVADSVQMLTLSPYTVSGQLQVNVSPRVTFTTAYTYTETPTRTGQKTIDKAIQAICNVQL